LQFATNSGAPIDINSFRAGYGYLDFEITPRLLTHATLTPAGLTTDKLDVPPGDHTVHISIADKEGHVAIRKYSFHVV
jgi:hypothetical protein